MNFDWQNGNKLRLLENGDTFSPGFLAQFSVPSAVCC